MQIDVFCKICLFYLSHFQITSFCPRGIRLANRRGNSRTWIAPTRMLAADGRFSAARQAHFSVLALGLVAVIGGLGVAVEVSFS